MLTRNGCHGKKRCTDTFDNIAKIANTSTKGASFDTWSNKTMQDYFRFLKTEIVDKGFNSFEHAKNGHGGMNGGRPDTIKVVKIKIKTKEDY